MCSKLNQTNYDTKKTFMIITLIVVNVESMTIVYPRPEGWQTVRWKCVNHLYDNHVSDNVR